MRFLKPLLLIFLLALSPALLAMGADTTATATENDMTTPAGIGIGLLDVPASTQNDPRARAYIIDRLAPGSEITRRVQVTNNTASAQTIYLYPGAASITGGSFVGAESGSINELTTWTSLTQTTIELPSGGKAEVPVSIKVPADAAEDEHYGAIWAEARSPATKGGVVQANRVGIRMYLSIGPGNGKPADFSITTLTAARDSEGLPQLSALVTNTGGRALDITGQLHLIDGPGQLSAGPFAVQQARTIAPGTSQNVTFTMPKELPHGPWTAQIKLKSGLLDRQASAPITFPEDGPGEAVAPIQESSNPWLPIAVSAAVLLVAAITALLALRHRRRREEVTATTSAH